MPWIKKKKNKKQFLKSKLCITQTCCSEDQAYLKMQNAGFGGKNKSACVAAVQGQSVQQTKHGLLGSLLGVREAE